MGNDMGNNNTASLKDDNDKENESPEKSHDSAEENDVRGDRLTTQDDDADKFLEKPEDLALDCEKGGHQYHDNQTPGVPDLPTNKPVFPRVQTFGWAEQPKVPPPEFAPKINEGKKAGEEQPDVVSPEDHANSLELKAGANLNADRNCQLNLKESTTEVGDGARKSDHTEPDELESETPEGVETDPLESAEIDANLSASLQEDIPYSVVKDTAEGHDHILETEIPMEHMSSPPGHSDDSGVKPSPIESAETGANSSASPQEDISGPVVERPAEGNDHIVGTELPKESMSSPSDHGHDSGKTPNNFTLLTQRVEADQVQESYIDSSVMDGDDQHGNEIGSNFLNDDEGKSNEANQLANNVALQPEDAMVMPDPSPHPTEVLELEEQSNLLMEETEFTGTRTVNEIIEDAKGKAGHFDTSYVNSMKDESIQPQLEINLGLDIENGNEESKTNVPFSCRDDNENSLKDELIQPQSEIDLGLGITNGNEESKKDVPSSCQSDKACDVDAREAIQNAFQEEICTEDSQEQFGYPREEFFSAPTQAERGVGESDHEEENPAEKEVVEDKQMELTLLHGNTEGASKSETTEQFVTRPATADIAVPLPHMQHNSLPVSNYDGTTLLTFRGTKASEDEFDNEFPQCRVPIMRSGDPEAAKSERRRLSIGSKSDNGTHLHHHPKQKSPSFDFNLRIESIASDSDQTPLLFQDKSAIRSMSMKGNYEYHQGERMECMDEKTVRLDRSDSGKSKSPVPGFSKEEKQEAPAAEEEESCVLLAASGDAKEGENKTSKTLWVVPAKEVGSVSPKGREKRRPRSSLFGNCMCCATVIN